MIEISKSVVDPRNVALILFAMGGTVLALGLLSWDWWVLGAGIAVIVFGVVILFGTKSTFKIVYDNKSELFTLNSRKNNVQIRKNQVMEVFERFTPLRLIWPFPRPYFFVLKVKNDAGNVVKYGFVIWSNQQLFLKHFEMMKRSVEVWNLTSNQTNPLPQ